MSGAYPARISLATSPARPDRPNEDAVATTPELVVVLDGASVPPGMEIGCAHGTPWYVRRLAAAVVAALADRPERPLTAGLAEAIAAVNELHPGCDLRHAGTPSAAVGIARLGEEEVELLSLADITLVATGPAVEPVVLVDNRIEVVCPPEPVALAGLRFGQAEHAAALAALVEAQRGRRNRDGGFWVAATDPAAADHALTRTLPRAGLDRLLVLTDGATRTVDQMGLDTWAELVTVAAVRGPRGVIDRVRAVELADPHGERHPRTKIHDDAAVVLVEW